MLSCHSDRSKYVYISVILSYVILSITKQQINVICSTTLDNVFRLRCSVILNVGKAVKSNSAIYSTAYRQRWRRLNGHFLV